MKQQVLKVCFFLAIFVALAESKATVILSERQTELATVVGEESEVYVDLERINGWLNTTLHLNLSIVLGDVNVMTVTSPRSVTLAAGSSFPLRLRGEKVGVSSMLVNITSTDPDVEIYMKHEALHYVVSVGHSYNVRHLGEIMGWIYVIVWNLSFYPQVIDNFRRKSVIGLHFDYLAFNTVGHSCYMIYNVGLFSIASVKEEYHRRHPFGSKPVAFNDLFFPIHGVVLCLTGVIQCLIYERGHQRVSTTCCTAIGAMLLIIVDRLYLSMMGYVHWIDWLYFLSTVKLAITLLKYIPQAYFNYQRKSTRGWAIGMVILDLFGGVFSAGQMLVLAWDYNDWTSLYGNLAKFGLGLFTVLFDIIFVLQHYCLYGEGKDEEVNEDDEEEWCNLMQHEFLSQSYLTFSRRSM